MIMMMIIIIINANVENLGIDGRILGILPQTLNGIASVLIIGSSPVYASDVVSLKRFSKCVYT
jgi:hypothetical protein